MQVCSSGRHRARCFAGQLGCAPAHLYTSYSILANSSMLTSYAGSLGHTEMGKPGPLLILASLFQSLLP
jgi:hypothetical protein